MINGSPSVTLSGEEIPLRLPGPFALRLDLYWAVSLNTRRACACALGLSMQRDPPLRAQCRRFGDQDLLEFGGAVIDELIAEGHPWSEIRDAGTTAWALVAESVSGKLDALPSDAEVKTAENFTDQGGARGTASPSK